MFDPNLIQVPRVLFSPLRIMKLGKAFRRARMRSGLRQNELAAQLDVSPTYISMLENDRRDPSWSFICRCCDALGIPISLLLLLASSDADESPVTTDGSTRIQRDLSGALMDLLSEALAKDNEAGAS